MTFLAAAAVDVAMVDAVPAAASAAVAASLAAPAALIALSVTLSAIAIAVDICATTSPAFSEAVFAWSLADSNEPRMESLEL
ncbi:MAG: hypothetical protein R3E83_01330 [Burkholderiaceae bacterium]